MRKHARPTHLLKVLAAVFAFLANVSLLQQLSSSNVTGDPLTVLASVTALVKDVPPTREEARKAVKATLMKVRPVRKRVLRGKVVERYRRPREVITDVPPPSLSKKTNEPERARCGDRLILLAEQCDDGNAVPGDGCDANCKIEAGYTCYGQPSDCIARCGDGLIGAREKCDDGNVDGGDGCDALCRIESGYECSGIPSACKIKPYCGNRILEGSETCDDGNSLAGDGCTATCVKE